MNDALRAVYPLCFSKGWVKDEEDYLNQWNEMQAILERAINLGHTDQTNRGYHG